jgi:hypothetical protein
VKDQDKIHRITGVILIMWYQITGFITANIFCRLICGLFLEQFSDRQVLDSVEIDSVRLVLFLGDQEQEEAVRLVSIVH